MQFLQAMPFLFCFIILPPLPLSIYELRGREVGVTVGPRYLHIADLGLVP